MIARGALARGTKKRMAAAASAVPIRIAAVCAAIPSGTRRPTGVQVELAGLAAANGRSAKAAPKYGAASMWPRLSPRSAIVSFAAKTATDPMRQVQNDRLVRLHSETLADLQRHDHEPISLKRGGACRLMFNTHPNLMASLANCRKGRVFQPLHTLATRYFKLECV
jgi:hypothetical protein